MAVTLFVESNFLLELVFQQKQHLACQELVNLTRAGKIELRMPMFCLMEPLFTLEGRRKSRKGLNRDLNTEMEQYMREAAGQEDVPAILSALNTLLIERGNVQQSRLIAVVGELMQEGIQLLPLDALVWKQLPAILSTTELELGDALVYATISRSLATNPPKDLALFATRDTDFKDPTVKQQLDKHNCSLLFDFSAALARIAAL